MSGDNDNDHGNYNCIHYYPSHAKTELLSRSNSCSDEADYPFSSFIFGYSIVTLENRSTSLVVLVNMLERASFSRMLSPVLTRRRDNGKSLVN